MANSESQLEYLRLEFEKLCEEIAAINARPVGLLSDAPVVPSDGSPSASVDGVGPTHHLAPPRTSSRTGRTKSRAKPKRNATSVNPTSQPSL